MSDSNIFTDDLDPSLHSFQVKLYPNTLAKGGPYLARTVNEQPLGIKDTVQNAISRGVIPANAKAQAIEYVSAYVKQRALDLANGFPSTDGYFTHHVRVTGSFEGTKDSIDRANHHIVVTTVMHHGFRRLMEKVRIIIADIIHTVGELDHLLDNEKPDYPHNVFDEGHMVTIIGDRIKIAGDHPANGIYFVPVDNPDAAVKVERIAENHAGTLMCLTPKMNGRFNRIQIRTQYAGGHILKEPRVITSMFTVEAL